MTYVPIENLQAARKIIHDRLHFSLLPFRVCNHLFQCCRSQYESNMCLFCTKLYLKNKKICRVIEKKLTINGLEYFPVQLSYGVITHGVVHLFVHSSVSDRQKLHGENTNFGILYYEVVSSLFILWKFYLDILARIVFNYCGKYIISDLLSGLDTDDCRNITVCSPIRCFGLKKNKIIEIVFISGIRLSKKLAKISYPHLTVIICLKILTRISKTINTYQ